MNTRDCSYGITRGVVEREPFARLRFALTGIWKRFLLKHDWSVNNSSLVHRGGGVANVMEAGGEGVFFYWPAPEERGV